jgi:hypothetical protein
MFSAAEFIFLAVVLAGFIDLVMGIVFLKRAGRFATEGQKAKAVVRGFYYRGGQAMPILSYRDARGNMLERTAPFAVDPNVYSEGKQVAIIYLPDAPREIMRDGGVNPARMIGLGCISGLFGIGVVIFLLLQAGVAAIPVF